MKSQLKEVLIYNGKDYAMACDPLNQYFSQMKSPLRFLAKSEVIQRGYLGKWAILNNELYLTEFKGVLENKDKITLSYIFPGQQTVFAEWFNGEILLNHGKILSLKSNNINTIYENDVHLEFANGHLMKAYTITNVLDLKSVSSTTPNHMATSELQGYLWQLYVRNNFVLY
jgi:hypothetical protein